MIDQWNKIRCVVMACMALVVTANVNASGGVSFKAVGDQPIISFYQSNGMVANSDIHSQVEIFSSGRVRVFVPHYMTDPGTYEYQLSDKSLHALISRLDYFGLMSFDVDAARNAKEQAIRQNSHTTYVVLDSTTTSMVLNFSQYGGLNGKSNELKRTIVWDDIAVDAKHYAQVSGLKGLADAEQLLLSLTDHERRGSKRISGGQ